jgi:hypothetical protein
MIDEKEESIALRSDCVTDLFGVVHFHMQCNSWLNFRFETKLHNIYFKL